MTDARLLNTSEAGLPALEADHGYLGGTSAAGQNLLDMCRPIVDLLVSRLASQGETVGIVLLGGLGVRGFVDVYSDLDIAVFVRDARSRHLPPFSFELDVGGRGVEFNVTQVDIDMERQRDAWSAEQRSAYRDGTIVWDPTGATARLLKEKLACPDSEYMHQLVGVVSQAYWRGIRHSRAAMARGFPESAHCLLNEAVDLLIEAHFPLNRMQRNHTKWRLDAIGRMRTAVPDVRQRVGEALRVLSMGDEDVKRRLQVVEGMLGDVVTLARQQFVAFPEDAYQYWARYLSGRQWHDNAVEQMCDYWAAKLSSEDLGRLRGALAVAVLRAPDSAEELAGVLEADGLICARLLAMLGADPGWRSVFS